MVLETYRVMGWGVVMLYSSGRCLYSELHRIVEISEQETNPSAICGLCPAVELFSGLWNVRSKISFACIR
jgi:hypothetical protein